MHELQTTTSHAAKKALDALTGCPGAARSRRHRAVADPAGARRPAGDLCLGVRWGRDGRAGAGGGAAGSSVKPFSPAELVARMGLALRRRTAPAPFVLGDLAIDRVKRRVTVAGRPVRLIATEYRLPHALSLDARGATTYESLLRRVWNGRDGGDRTGAQRDAQARRRRRPAEVHPHRARARLPHAETGRAVTVCGDAVGRAVDPGPADEVRPACPRSYSGSRIRVRRCHRRRPLSPPAPRRSGARSDPPASTRSGRPHSIAFRSIPGSVTKSGGTHTGSRGK